MEEFLGAPLPRFLKLGRCDVPVRPTFPGQGMQVPAEIFHDRPTEEPIALVDPAGLKDNDVERRQGAQDFPCSQRTERRLAVGSASAR